MISSKTKINAHKTYPSARVSFCHPLFRAGCILKRTNEATSLKSRGGNGNVIRKGLQRAVETIGLIGRVNNRGGIAPGFESLDTLWQVSGSKIVGTWLSEIRTNPVSHLARQGWRFIRRQLRCNVAAAARGGGRFCRRLVEIFPNSTKQTA